MTETIEEMLKRHKREMLEAHLRRKNGELRELTEKHISPLLREIEEIEREIRELNPEPLPEGYEMFKGKPMKVLNSHRSGWWRFHEHYDRDGYCDNPARGY